MNLREQKNRTRKWLNLLRKIKPYLKWVEKNKTVEWIALITLAFITLVVVGGTVVVFFLSVIYFFVQIFQFPFTLTFDLVNPIDSAISFFWEMSRGVLASSLHGKLFYVICLELFLYFGYHLFKISYYAVLKKLIEITRKTRKKEKELFED